MARLVVVACPKCRRAKVAERGRKTTQCGVCGKPIKLDVARVLYETDMEDAAREAAGLVNAKLAGREAEFQRSLEDVSEARPVPPPASPKAAALRALSASPAPLRVEAAARALKEFSEKELAEVLAEAGLAVTASEALRQLAARGILTEPRLGRYRLVE